MKFKENQTSTDWATIGFTEGKGTTTEQTNYSFVDDISAMTQTNLYYRLKQIDFNGDFSYSDVVNVFLFPG